MSSATELFAIVPVPGRTPDDAIVIGDLKEVMQYIPQSVARDDAIAELDRARFTADQISSLQQKTRGVQVTMINDSISHLSQRLDKILARRDAQARARKRRDDRWSNSPSPPDLMLIEDQSHGLHT